MNLPSAFIIAIEEEQWRLRFKGSAQTLPPAVFRQMEATVDERIYRGMGPP